MPALKKTVHLTAEKPLYYARTRLSCAPGTRWLIRPRALPAREFVPAQSLDHHTFAYQKLYLTLLSDLEEERHMRRLSPLKRAYRLGFLRAMRKAHKELHDMAARWDDEIAELTDEMQGSSIVLN